MRAASQLYAYTLNKMYRRKAFSTVEVELEMLQRCVLPIISVPAQKKLY